MKRVFLFITIALFAGSVMAEGHMKFLGIEMTGNTESFAKQIEAKGYTMLGSLNGMTMLTGTFSGYNNCKIVIMGSTSGEIVKIVVMFPDAYSWTQLYDMYSTLRNRLTNKYGTPVINKETWSDDNRKNASDDMKFFYAKHGYCNFQTAYLTELGEIDLDMKGNNGTVVLCVSYFDMETQLKALQKAEDDL